MDRKPTTQWFEGTRRVAVFRRDHRTVENHLGQGAIPSDSRGDCVSCGEAHSVSLLSMACPVAMMSRVPLAVKP